jgi:hypothetical protein
VSADSPDNQRHLAMSHLHSPFVVRTKAALDRSPAIVPPLESSSPPFCAESFRGLGSGDKHPENSFLPESLAWKLDCVGG